MVVLRVGAACGGGEQAADVLGDDPLGLQHVDRRRHLRPQARAGARCEAGSLADRGDVLAGEPAANHVDRRDLPPVDLRDVAKVGDSGPVMREHAGRGGVELGEPGRASAEDVLDGEVEAAVAGEQRSDPQRGGRGGG